MWSPQITLAGSVLGSPNSGPATAARMRHGEDPIGKRFSRRIPNEKGFEVVGLVRDARMTSLDEGPPLMVYIPYWWRSRPTLARLIKPEVEPTSLIANVRGAGIRVARGAQTWHVVHLILRQATRPVIGGARLAPDDAATQQLSHQLRAARPLTR